MYAKIALLGATGHTGRFVAAELCQRGLRPVLTGRDRAKLAALSKQCNDAPWRVADFTDPRSLDAAVSDTAVIVNCAGPFFDTAEPAIAAALRHNVDYLDVTAEQITALNTLHRHHHSALRAGIAIIPSMAFYGGLADLMAGAAMGDWPDADRLTVAVALDSWHPTEGTRRTGARNTARRYWLRDGRLEHIPEAFREVAWDFAPPFGPQQMTCVALAEVITLSQHLDIREIVSLMNLAPLRDLRDPQIPPPVAVDAYGRSAQHFAVEVRLERNGERRALAITGRDIYAISGTMIAEAAHWLCTARARPRGALAPAAAFNATEFLAAIFPGLASKP